MKDSYDAYLWKQVSLGNQTAFEKLFKKYYVSATNYAISLTKSIAFAEDLIEDCFLKIWLRRNEIIIQSSFRAYPFRFIHNRCLNYIEQNKSFTRFETDPPTGYTVSDSDMYELDPHSELLFKECEKDINRAIESLPTQCKNIFMLNRFEGLKYREIAEKLNISITTVKTQMSRALLKLQQELKDYLITIAILLSMLY